MRKVTFNENTLSLKELNKKTIYILLIFVYKSV